MLTIVKSKYLTFSKFKIFIPNFKLVAFIVSLIIVSYIVYQKFLITTLEENQTLAIVL